MFQPQLQMRTSALAATAEKSRGVATEAKYKQEFQLATAEQKLKEKEKPSIFIPVLTSK